MARGRTVFFQKRKENTRSEKDMFLICCEGAQTEPNYFKSFRLATKDVTEIDVRGLGDNTLSLVQRTIDLRREKEYDQVWCVFDRDPGAHPADHFNKAIDLAEKNDIKIAYSNQSFELWYLLHFNYYDTGMDRGLYMKKLDDCMGHKYRKNSRGIYDELLEKQPTAIKHAKKLLKTYKILCPEKNDPSTTVHLLVTELNKFITI